MEPFRKGNTMQEQFGESDYAREYRARIKAEDEQEMQVKVVLWCASIMVSAVVVAWVSSLLGAASIR